MNTLNAFVLIRVRLISILLLLLFCYSFSNAQVFINASDNLPEDGASGQSVDVMSVDIDQDGDKDIILANEYQVNSILYNNGQAHFDYNPNTLLATLHDSEDIAVADFDLDGDLDILFVSEDDFEHEFFLNNGSGNFELTPIEPFSASNSVCVEDFNGDGIPDLFIGNLGQNYILINDGFASFTNETTTRLPNVWDVTYDAKIVDVDNDGDNDIVVANQDGNRILINQGGGYFEDETDIRFPSPVMMDTRKLVPGDVNEDGYIDLMLCNVEFVEGNDPQNRLYINDGTGIFSDQTESHIPEYNDQTMDGIFMDFDEDGDQDILLTNVLHSPLLVYKNDGDGKFSDANAIALGTLEFTLEGLGIVTDDFNGDSLADIYICNRTGKDLLLLRDPEMEVTSTTEPTVYQGKLWPNPVESSFAIEKGDWNNTPEFRLVDILGRKVANLTIESETAETYHFQLPKHKMTGIYFLEIRLKDTVLLKELFFK